MSDEVIFSDFCERLKPCGRILELEGYNVWCCSPIYGDDGRVHVFYSRWKDDFNYWVADCEIGHAVADRPEGPYRHVDVALKGRGGTEWDSWSCHNPTIHKVGNKYALLYMGSDGSGLDITKNDLPGMDWNAYKPRFMKLVESKRIGLAVADSLNGPWKRISDQKPLIEPSPEDWDGIMTTNPALVQLPGGRFRLYYKSIDWKSWREIFGIRRYGAAEADRLEGPYTKYNDNPVLTFEHMQPRFIANESSAKSKEKEYEFETAQVEDAYVWQEADGTFRMICRDMGFFNHEYGLYLESSDGLDWSAPPKVAYRDSAFYFHEEMPGLAREGRLERPQILMKDGVPDYLFCAFRGGKYKTASGAVLKIEKGVL